LSGELGDPPGGWPEPFRTKALQGRTTKPRVTELTDDDRAGLVADPRATLNRLLFPGPTDDFETARAQYGDLSVVPTGAFLYGLQHGGQTEVEIAEGTLLLIGIEAIGDADERGIRNVLGTINGQLRPTEVRDQSVDSKVTASEKADPTNPGHVAVPFAGVVHALVAEGDTVQAGQSVATIEAMKMEASITTPNAGTITRLVITDTQQAEGGDLLLILG
jgi:pyruvate carboxylase